MKCFCIFPEAWGRVAPDLFQKCNFSIQGMGAFIEAESAADVLRMDAAAGGKLTAADMMEVSPKALANVQKHMPCARRYRTWTK